MILSFIILISFLKQKEFKAFKELLTKMLRILSPHRSARFLRRSVLHLLSALDRRSALSRLGLLRRSGLNIGLLRSYDRGEFFRLPGLYLGLLYGLLCLSELVLKGLLR